jgi:hypothetical protein
MEKREEGGDEDLRNSAMGFENSSKIPENYITSHPRRLHRT